jgi:rare lipoprotein A
VASAAHKTLPLPSLVEVTNLANGRTLIVRVNDRGPFVDGRVIDMSKAAAEELGFVAAGVTRVRVRYVGQASAPPEPRQYQALNDTLRQQMPKPSMPRPGLPKLQFKFSAPPLQLAEVPPVPVPLAAPLPSVTPSFNFARAEAVKSVAPPVPPAAEAAPNAELARAEAITQAPLTPVAPATLPEPALADVDSLLNEAAPTAQAAQAATSAVSAVGSYQLQAGVFASRLNAEALASRLGDVGASNVEPFERNGQTLYRVVVRGFTNPTAAAAARTQAAAMGAPDARVIAGVL